MPLSIEQQEPESQQDEEHQNGVEQSGSRHNDCDTVDCEEEAGESGPHRRFEESEGDKHCQQNGKGAEQGNAEAPAERVARAEQPHAGTDYPFAEWRVHHERAGL